ncbi:MAG: SCP2 sterol-binding domain-containing protein [Salinisphaera sp.]|nr:SCP2 sterol-binding domain-containing protein [Salinisphaera sp.]
MSAADTPFRGLPTPALGAAEIALNRYIGQDPRALERAAALAGRSLTVCFSDFRLAVTFIAETHGMQLVGLPEGEPDVRLTGRSTAFGRVFFASRDAGRGQSIAGAGLRIEGDIGIAQQFADLFAGVDFNLGDLIDARLGPVPAYFAEQGLKTARSFFGRLRRELPEQAAEYLREESRDVIGGWEHERFADDVATLRDDVERIAARVRRLQKTPR